MFKYFTVVMLLLSTIALAGSLPTEGHLSIGDYLGPSIMINHVNPEYMSVDSVILDFTEISFLLQPTGDHSYMFFIKNDEQLDLLLHSNTTAKLTVISKNSKGRKATQTSQVKFTVN